MIIRKNSIALVTLCAAAVLASSSVVNAQSQTQTQTSVPSVAPPAEKCFSDGLKKPEMIQGKFLAAYNQGHTGKLHEITCGYDHNLMGLEQFFESALQQKISKIFVRDIYQADVESWKTKGFKTNVIPTHALVVEYEQDPNVKTSRYAPVKPKEQVYIIGEYQKRYYLSATTDAHK